MEVAADAAGVTRSGRRPGEAGQPVRAPEGVHVAAGRGHELGTESVAPTVRARAAAPWTLRFFSLVSIRLGPARRMAAGV